MGTRQPDGGPGRFVLAVGAFVIAACMPLRWERDASTGRVVRVAMDANGYTYVDPGWRWSRPAIQPGHRRMEVSYVLQEYYNRDILPTRRRTLEMLYPRGLNIAWEDPRYAALVDRGLGWLEQEETLSSGDVRRLRATPWVNTSDIYWFGWCRIVVLATALVAGFRLMPWRWLCIELPEAMVRDIGSPLDYTACQACRYPLEGLPTRTCPECGHANPKDPGCQRVPVE